MVLEKTLQSPLDSKEIQPVHPRENQHWIFIGRTDAKASILWPSDARSWLTGKGPDAGKDWRQEEKAVTEDEMAEWQHRLNGHQSELTLGESEEQGSPACCSPSSHKESDTTEQLSNSRFKALLPLLPGTGLKLQPNWAASCEEAPAPILSHAMRQDTLASHPPKHIWTAPACVEPFLSWPTRGDLQAPAPPSLSHNNPLHCLQLSGLESSSFFPSLGDRPTYPSSSVSQSAPQAAELTIQPDLKSSPTTDSLCDSWQVS